jgi:hypothetical protein
LFNKAEAFVRVKPFNDASSHCRHNKSYKILIVNKALKKGRRAGKFGNY